MYEAHFGLKSRAFGSKAEGSGVFTGPRQVEIMTSLKKALAAHDAVVTVTGPVGVGKTTIVNRSLETLTSGRMAAWVGRMALAPDEVLDLLLAGFGIGGKARGTIQRFALFRRLLTERAAAGAQVAIVVEDAVRIGADALVELEALTAADAGDGAGANIILMGQPGLHKLLSSPELARMKQRSRLRQEIPALTLPETQGYLKHCLREAGGDYDRIFGAGVADIVHGCSEGIPRLINTLCESALSAAMENGQATVTARLMHKIAVDAFGYEGPLPDGKQDAPVEAPAADAVVESTPATAEDATADIDWEKPGDVDVAAIESMDEADLPPAARNIVVESGRYPEIAASSAAPAVPDTPAAEKNPAPPAEQTAPPPAPQPAPPTSSPEPAANESATAAPEEDDFEIPELIEDTQPELSKLSVPIEASEPNDPAYEKTGSTAIQKAPPGLEALAAGEPADQADDSGNFDLDAALAIDAEDTNIMQAMTPDLDAIASESAGKAANEATAKAPETPAKEMPPAQSAPAPDDLPTLSDSMRVDVDEEVDKAKKAMAANEAPAATATPTPTPAPAAQPAAKTAPAPAPTTNSPAPKAAAAPKPAAATPPATDNAAPTPPPAAKAPAPEAEPAPKPAAPAPKAAPTPPPVAAQPATPPAASQATQAPAAKIEKAEDTDVAKASPAPAAAQTAAASTPAATEDDEPEMLTLEPDLDLLEQNAPGPATDEIPAKSPASAMPAAPAAQGAPAQKGPAPVAKVSEMTARIAALDPASRSNDVDALEEALAAAKKGELDQMLEAAAAPAPAATVQEVAADVPEITLDDVLSKQENQNAELDKFAAEIGKANSLEEFSDKMAETLFGDQDFDAIAAEVVANPPEGFQAKGSLPGEETEENPALELEPSPEPTAAAPAQPEPAPAQAPDIRVALDNLETEEVEMSTGTYEALPANTNGPAPETIENQFETSMTATLEALSVSKVADEVAEEKEEKKSGGFFSRFRKSS